MSTWIETIMGKKAGEIETVTPDYVVINDGPSHGAADEITALADRDLVWVIYDHDVPTGSPEAAAVVRKLLQFSGRYGCRYVQAEGTGYQYMMNQVVKPGEIVIGGGSHGSIFGAIGALGVNVSVPELARIAETGRYSAIVPETVSVMFTGELEAGVDVMDAAMTFLKTTDGLEGKVIEFVCGMLKPYEKAVLCSMACMTGAYTAHAAENGSADDGGYHVIIDLSQVKPMVMLPCEDRQSQMKAGFSEKSELEGMTVNAGQIGGYTGGTIEALRKAAALMEGQTLARGFRLTVCPAASSDYIAAMEEGILTKFIDYGAQISAAGDHSALSQGAGTAGPGECLLTTGLYTFAGAMGCSDAKIYSASVDSVIKASYTKQI